MMVRLVAVGFAILLTTLSAAAAAPVYKCSINGSITFQGSPCPSTVARTPPTLEQLNAERLKRPRENSAESIGPPGLASGVQGSVDSPPAPAVQNYRKPRFTCDGRTHCSQMSSCAEAKFFLANCSGVKMDGNHDGVPCEEQWCN